MLKKNMGFILTLVTLISTSVVTFAEIKSVGGGTWDYGVNKNKGGLCWSYYTHKSVKHGSTAESDIAVDVKCVDPGQTSMAHVLHSDHNNHAYWHRCGVDRVCN